MPYTTASAASALWRIAIPSIMVNAGSGGAMLSITLLKPTVLTLYGGHAFVLHDPLGLMGERLLAHVHRALADRPMADRPAPPMAACRWVTARSPLSAVWEAADAMANRGVWRTPRRRWPDGMPHQGPRAARVAEARGALSPPHSPASSRPAAALASSGSGTGEHPRVLLLSESEQPDALAPHTAARLLLRAMRYDWAVFAVTRQGPARVRDSRVGDSRVGDSRVGDSRLRDSGVREAPRPGSASAPPAASWRDRATGPWRTHLVCRSGALEPLPRLMPVPELRAVRAAHSD
jgi:hypothetical protein